MAKIPVENAIPETPFSSDDARLLRLLKVVERMREVTVDAAVEMLVDDVDVYAEALVHLAAVAAHRSGRPLGDYEVLFRSMYEALDDVLARNSGAA